MVTIGDLAKVEVLGAWARVGAGASDVKDAAEHRLTGPYDPALRRSPHGVLLTVHCTTAACKPAASIRTATTSPTSAG